MGVIIGLIIILKKKLIMRFLFFIQNTSEYDILSFTLVFFFNLSYVTVFVRKSFLYFFFLLSYMQWAI